ncbi:MAG: hypothetical protein LBQ62_03685 [Candidatus Accumulibacter sp.]|nr:hypothetical protein [Accumulibacter sp.]
MIGLPACGGGSGGGESRSSANAAWQRNLPPDPGSAATASLTGVDVNNNGLRDDLERNAAMTANSEESFQATASLMRALQRTIDPSTTGENVAEVAQEAYCAAKNRPESANDDLPEDVLDALVFDTEERRAARRDYIRSYGVRTTSEGETSCEQ